MKLVKQHDETGCGLACIAMLSGLEYKVIRCIAKEYKLSFKQA